MKEEKLMEPRVYFGYDFVAKKWEVILVGFKEPQMGITFDVDKLADCLNIISQIPIKYPDWKDK